MIGKKIKDYIDSSNYSVEDVAKMVQISKQGLYQILKKEDIDTGVLRKISQALNVPMSYWFGGEVVVPQGKTLEQKYIEALEEIRDLHRELKQLHK